jgi:hypothetical protein
MPSAVDEITWLHPDPSASPPPIARLAASRLSVPLSPFLVAVLGRWAARKRGRCRGPIGGWPSAPSKIALLITGLRFATVLAQALRARSLPSAGTCADVRVWIGRRSVPAGPPDGDGDGGREGRERPGLPRIWVGPGPASRVAHAPCRWQFVRTNAARIESRSAPSFCARASSRSCRPTCSRSNSRDVVL